MHQVVDDWRQAPLTEAVSTLLEFAEKVTRTPAACSPADIAVLRAANWPDESIHDAVQVVGYFSYINRIADALGVELEPDFPHWGRTGGS